MIANPPTGLAGAWRATPDKVTAAVQRLVEAARPQRIILFGSHASGDAAVDSDVDLLVVEPEVHNAAAESVRLRRVLKDLRLPVDLLVVSEARFTYWRDTPGTLFYEASREGRVVYEAA